MADIIEVVTVTDPFGGCPECGNGGTIKCDDKGLDWLVCKEHNTRWFLGAGFSGCALPSFFPMTEKEVTPLPPGEKLYIEKRVRFYGDNVTELVQSYGRKSNICDYKDLPGDAA